MEKRALPFKEYQKKWCRSCKYNDRCIGADEICAMRTDSEASFLTYMLMVQNTILMCKAETTSSGEQYNYSDVIEVED